MGRVRVVSFIIRDIIPLLLSPFMKFIVLPLLLVLGLGESVSHMEPGLVWRHLHVWATLSKMGMLFGCVLMLMLI